MARFSQLWGIWLILIWHDYCLWGIWPTLVQILHLRLGIEITLRFWITFLTGSNSKGIWLDGKDCLVSWWIFFLSSSVLVRLVKFSQFSIQSLYVGVNILTLFVKGMIFAWGDFSGVNKCSRSRWGIFQTNLRNFPSISFVLQVVLRNLAEELLCITTCLTEFPKGLGAIPWMAANVITSRHTLL